MKHIILSDQWTFDLKPFPAYRIELSFGRTKKASQFLTVKGVTPVVEYTVKAGFGFVGFGSTEVIYQGTDKSAAEAAKARHEAQPAKVDESAKVTVTSPFSASGSQPRKPWATITESKPTLPEGGFRLITTKEKGTKMIVSGSDTTDDLLLFVGCKDGYRGGSKILAEATTGEVVMSCQAGNATDGQIEVVARLKPGQTIGFYTYGSDGSVVIQHTWDGSELKTETYSKPEWDAYVELQKPIIEAEEAPLKLTWTPDGKKIIPTEEVNVADVFEQLYGLVVASGDTEMLRLVDILMIHYTTKLLES